MEITGLIKDIPLDTLLDQAEAEEQTGVLFLKGEQGIGEVSFENGLIYSADYPCARERLGQRLVQEGAIHPADLCMALRDQENGQNRLLGEILFEKNLLPSERVKRVVEQQIEEAVVHLLMWEKGQFTFERTPPKRPPLVLIRPNAILKEKKKRIKELRSLPAKTPLDRIESHPNPRIHHHLYQEIQHTFLRTKVFEPKIMILLVEGDAKWRMMVNDELAKRNFQVKGASNLEKARFEIDRMLEKGYSPIVITDIGFPHEQASMKLEGLSFMENLHKKHPEIPILVCTSYPISNLRRKILFLGGIFCLVKPDLSVISSKNFEQIFQSFIIELVYCLDISIHHCYQEYFRVRAELVEDDLIEDLYNRETEMIRLGDQVIEDAQIQKTLYEVSSMLVKEGNVDRAIEDVLDFIIERYDHVALFTWKKKYLEGYIGKSSLRADFPEKVRSVSVEFDKIPFLKRLYTEKRVFAGPPPEESEYTKFLNRFLEKKPSWHFLYPVEIMGKVVALWYADAAQVKERDLYTQVMVSLVNLIILSLKMDMEND